MIHKTKEREEMKKIDSEKFVIFFPVNQEIFYLEGDTLKVQ